MPRECCAAMTEGVHEALRSHLIRPDGDEDLAFALWSPSAGAQRLTALIHTVLLPQEGDRQVHGNVSFNQQYFERVCRLALAEGLGIAFLHSHPYPGWQGMSWDDVVAERRLAGATAALTDLPLVGLTIGSDGAWSARFWDHGEGRAHARQWCSNVRVLGSRLRVTYSDELLPPPAFRDMFKRTISVWGPEAHVNLARLRVGIVGLGSVGALVAESLARMGLTRFLLIDFDRVEAHNLDRLVIATEADIGRLKTDVARDRMLAIATAESADVCAVPFSIVEPEGYCGGLDCDVLFCCVD